MLHRNQGSLHAHAQHTSARPNVGACKSTPTPTTCLKRPLFKLADAALISNLIFHLILAWQSAPAEAAPAIGPSADDVPRVRSPSAGLPLASQIVAPHGRPTVDASSALSRAHRPARVFLACPLIIFACAAGRGDKPCANWVLRGDLGVAPHVST